MIFPASQTPLRTPIPTSFTNYGSCDMSEKQSEKNLVEIVQETPVRFWNALFSPLMSCFSTCFPAAESETAEFNEKNNEALALFSQKGREKLPMRSNNYIKTLVAPLVSGLMSQFARINANSTLLPPGAEQKIQKCQEDIGYIINYSDLTEEVVIKEVKEILNPLQHIGVYFDTYNFDKPNYIRNCKIVLNAIIDKTNIEGIKLHANYFFADVFGSREIIDGLKLIFAKNTALNWIDLSFDHAFNFTSSKIEQLRSLKEVLAGRKIASLDLSGNITRGFGFSDSTMKEICSYFGEIEITKLHLDNTNFKGAAAHYELELLRDALPKANGLQILTLRNYELQKMGADILFSALGRTSIETLDVSGNHLTDSEKTQLNNRSNKFGQRINIIL